MVHNCYYLNCQTKHYNFVFVTYKKTCFKRQIQYGSTIIRDCLYSTSFIKHTQT